MTRRRRRKLFAQGLALTTVILLGGAVAGEVRSSWLQSELLSRFARQLTFSVEPGPSDEVRFPSSGPYDSRLGYAQLPQFAERLQQSGFEIERQARWSERHLRFVEHGGYPIYDEKTAAGLTLLDQHGATVFAARFPERTYASFEEIPPLVVNTLLFIEHRRLLDESPPNRNPAIEWNRMAAILPGYLQSLVDPSVKAPGGSTLATQIEKYRHAPSGLTENSRAKLRQMVSASVRAYRTGADTSATRRQIVVDYINSTPLSARAAFGEINGLGDGLWAWFGTDLAEANRILSATPADAEQMQRKAEVYRQVIGLLLAQRRPSYYLLAGRDRLASLADSYLRVLIAQEVIDRDLGRAALAAELRFRDDWSAPRQAGHVDKKAADAIRRELLQLLGVPGYYQLDRLDLQVETSVDLPTQQRVAEILRQLADPAMAKEMGLFGHRLLETGKPGESLIYSLTLLERGEGVNYVRVQADNIDGPFDLNQGAKLDLGSTAKLRTLITYLEIVAELHRDFADRHDKERRLLAEKAGDPITLWVSDHLAKAKDPSLAGVLAAAMLRRYSASPAESFLTGGGVHRFANFDSRHNGQVITIAEAFRDSVNLPFIRLMRDILRYELARAELPGEEILGDPKHPARLGYLVRFADREGTTFLNRFYDEFRGHNPDAALERLARQVRPAAHRLATVFRSVRPDAGPAELANFLQQHLPNEKLSEKKLYELYDRYSIERFGLHDRGYIAGVHPLKLWLVGHLQQEPAATRRQVLDASADQRQEVYAWLFKTNRKHAQDKRIRILLEEEAFARIHKRWQRLGYPFNELVPSLATSIGSSADRPEALAELVGIIVNDGVWQPSVRVERLHFAADTPYETVAGLQQPIAQRLLAPEIAQVLQKAMTEVVTIGTARRLHRAFDTDGRTVAIGAKTGTGDHRRKMFAPGGRLVGSEAVSRTATVVFFIGDRFFGNVTIFVPGPDAARFTFTSSLPAQLLNALAPALQPLLDGPTHRVVEASARGDA